MNAKQKTLHSLHDVWDSAVAFAKDKWKYFALGAAGLALSTGALAQKAEVEAIMKDKAGRNLTGRIEITGDTSITDNIFTSPKTYILKNITGIDDHVLNGEEIIVAGNPTREGNTKLIFRNYSNLEGTLVAINMIGQELDRAKLPDDINLNFATKPGIIFINYINGSDKKTFKIVNNNNNFNLDVIQEQGASMLPEKPELKSSKGAFANNYVIKYTDLTFNVDEYIESFTVLPGNKHLTNATPNWSPKNQSYSSNTNKGTTMSVINKATGEVLDEETSSTGIIPLQTFQHRFDNTTGINLEYIMFGAYTDTAKFLINQFANQTFSKDTIRKGQFYVTINTNGDNYKVKEGTETLAEKLAGQEAFFKKQGDQLNVVFEVSGAGKITKNVPATINKGITTQTINLDLAQYLHLANVVLTSNKSGKEIKPNTDVYLTSNPGDTIWTKTGANGIFSFQFYDNNIMTAVKIGSRNIPGHNPLEITANIDDNENVSGQAVGKDYSISQQIHVLNQTGDNVANVKVSGGASDVFTNAQGIAIYNLNNVLTDIFNVPLSTYPTNITLSASNIQTLNAIINSIVGTNPEVLKNVNQIYAHIINGLAQSSKAGKIIKNNTEIYISKMPGDTARVLVSNGAFTYEFSDLNKSTNVDIGSLSVPGHSPGKITKAIDDNETAVVNFVADNYNINKPVRFQDQFSEFVSDATIVGGDTPVTTDANGRANVIDTNVDTDINNVPFSSYLIPLTITGDHLQTSNQNVNAIVGINLEQLLNIVRLPTAVHDFYITLKDINGDIVTDLTQKFEFDGDGAVMNLTPDANGRIHVQKTEYTNPSTFVKVSNNSVKYSDFQVYRKQNHSLADTNYCQIPKFDGLPQFANLKLTGISLENTEYVSTEKVKVPDFLIPTYGDSISITDPIVRDMMGGANFGKTIKFISRAGAEAIYVFQMTFNETTGLPMAQAQLDRAKIELDKVRLIYTQSDGNKLLNHEFYLINSYADSKWLEAQARDNFDNIAYTTFDNSSPYNGESKTITYSTNNEYRLKNSFSKYNTVNSDGIIFTEIYQQFTNNKDPTQGSAVWVRSTTGEVTEFGKTMARLLYLLNQGTPTQ